MASSYKRFAISIVLDAIGFIPIPIMSIIWAPFSGYIMTKMYPGKKGKIAGIISFIEELLPIDIIPTFTIMWIYTYVISKLKSKDMIKT
jgi:hypothetical protein